MKIGNGVCSMAIDTSSPAADEAAGCAATAAGTGAEAICGDDGSTATLSCVGRGEAGAPTPMAVPSLFGLRGKLIGPGSGASGWAHAASTTATTVKATPPSALRKKVIGTLCRKVSPEVFL